MDRIRVRGGRDLRGSVPVSGSKNSSLPILAATLLVDGPVLLRNVPDLKDVDTMCRILRHLGMRFYRHDDRSLFLEVEDATQMNAPYDLVRTMRASFVVLGALWARRGQARVSYPGGCVLGHRPVDLHLKGLQGIGARLVIEDGYVNVGGEVSGGTVYLGGSQGPTVLGTANVVMAAALGKGTTMIECAAMEPEVEDLCNFLNACGARISGIGGHCLVVEGVERLHGCEYTIIPDRIEAATYLVGALMTNSPVAVEGARPEHLIAVLDALREAGANLRVERNCITNVPTPDGKVRAVSVTTHPYPGFPTDIQAQFMALMTRAEGTSVITERVYPERFMHAAELARLGAQIRREGPSAIVHGTPHLSGAPVMASDLRASASLVLAGLVADGHTDVRRVYHIDRGYERIEAKLQHLGADIERISEG
jgi:UDP-N-acetylglucosamine 1-carboxyvinyltransferase